MKKINREVIASFSTTGVCDTSLTLTTAFNLMSSGSYQQLLHCAAQNYLCAPTTELMDKDVLFQTENVCEW